MTTVTGLLIRPGQAEDSQALFQWMSDPEIARDLPLGETSEIEEASKRWVEFHQQKGVLVAVYQGVPVGIAILFLQHYQRIRHQCLHVLLVAKEYRGMGIGSALLEKTMELAKREHAIELFHVEIYGNAEAELFYRRRGFVEFARQERWIKDGDRILNRVCLEKFI